MWVPLLALVLGFLAGKTLSFPLHPSMATYLSIATLATLDSTLGGIKGVLEENYDGLILMTGFFVNGAISAFMVFMGDWIGVDLYYVAIFVFGLRIFQNLAVVRRILINRFLSSSVEETQSTSGEV